MKKIRIEANCWVKKEAKLIGFIFKDKNGYNFNIHLEPEETIQDLERHEELKMSE